MFHSMDLLKEILSVNFSHQFFVVVVEPRNGRISLGGCDPLSFFLRVSVIGGGGCGCG